MTELVLRPWFDRAALHAIAHWYFPLSRAWAAALDASDLDDFIAGTGPLRLPRAQIARAVAHAKKRDRQYRRAADAWDDAFFGTERGPAGATLVEVENARIGAAHSLMSARSAFIPLHLSRRLPAIRWEIAGEDAVEARHGTRLSVPYPPPPPIDITQSHAMPASGEHVSWWRFPSGDDSAWARVATPTAVRDPATLIFLHGIAMETEFWRIDPRFMLRELTEAGVRVIRPEGPTHGRRRLRGWYGGEPVMARGPLGMLDLLQQWVRETGQLVAWARATSRGPVAVGGVSLGAITSQLVATAATGWPAEMRPDALFLVATSGDVVNAAAEGGLGRALGAPEQLASRGWTTERLARWRPLFDPVGSPAVEPGRIVMVLGAEDVVTPFEGGVALAARWKVPRQNIFVRRQGHFSVALGLSRRTDPLRRLVELLR